MLMNEAYAVEYEGEMAFRCGKPTFDAGNIVNPNRMWYLSEAEQLRGAVAFNLDGIIEHIVVHPTVQRRGIGSEMIQAVATVLKEKGLDEMRLSTVHFRQDVTSFCVRNGLKECGGQVMQGDQYTRMPRKIEFRRSLVPERVQRTTNSSQLEGLVTLLMKQLRTPEGMQSLLGDNAHLPS